jgi:hypothetical protein
MKTALEKSPAQLSETKSHNRSPSVGGFSAGMLSHRLARKLRSPVARSGYSSLACAFALAVTSCVTSCTVPLENQLVDAAGKDDLARFKKIAGKGVSLDAQEKGMQGYTPLIETTFVSGTNVFCYLLSAGAKVDARNRDGETALMTAVMLGDANLFKIRALINAGADVNARDKSGTPVLKFALWAGMGTPPRSTTNTISLLRGHGARE